MNERKRVALVTGASRGIGAAVAQRLAGEGLVVVINYAGNTQAAETTLAAIESSGGTGVLHRCDISDAAAVKVMFDRIETEFGGLDVLVNNAGVMLLSPLASVDDQQIDRQLDINLKGTLNTLRQAANRLRDHGRIVNLSTSVVATKFESYGVYAATKAAVETLTPILAKELRGKSITVNAVAPGPTATELFLDGKPPSLIDKLAQANPLQRLGQPADIANAVSFLVGPDGEWVNGQVLRVNGGMV